MLAKWKKVEELPPIVDEIDSVDSIINQSNKQFDGQV